MPVLVPSVGNFAISQSALPPLVATDVLPTTNIKSVFQSENVVIIEFETTIGAKYSVQIIPFGQEIPVKKEGFTATNTTTQRVYDLSEESKGYYDLVFLDVSGKEIKYPIIIK